MTLIFSAERDGLVLTISDLMITGTSATTPVTGVLDPIPSNPRAGTGYVVDYKQKAISFDARRLLLWAGDAIAAHKVAVAVGDAIRHGWSYDLVETVGLVDLTKEQEDNLHLIFHEAVSDNFYRQRFMCKELVLYGQTVNFMGSGDVHFFDLTQPLFLDQDEDDVMNFLRPWIIRLGTVLFDEAINKANYEFQYGGWFEVAFSDAFGLSKVPYLVKFWRDDGERVASLPLVSTWYIDQHLCIATATTKAGEEPSISYRIVPDPLARTSVPTDVASVLASYAKPRFQIHIVFDRLMRFGITAAGDNWPWFTFDLEDGAFQMRGKAGVIGEVLRPLREGASGMVYRPPE